MTKTVVIEIPSDREGYAEAMARARELSLDAFVQRLINVVFEDRMVNAVLDDMRQPTQVETVVQRARESHETETRKRSPRMTLVDRRSHLLELCDKQGAFCRNDLGDVDQHVRWQKAIDTLRQDGLIRRVESMRQGRGTRVYFERATRPHEPSASRSDASVQQVGSPSSSALPGAGGACEQVEDLNAQWSNEVNTEAVNQ
jgi:hypothetical protein